MAAVPLSSGEDDPIFIVGAGRTGSTIFFELLAQHPQLAWLSKLAQRYPRVPLLNRWLMHAWSVSALGKLLPARLGPSEAYPFWDSCCPGFSNPYRDLRAEDVTPASASRLRKSIRATLTRGRPRFLAKITGWPRVLYLREIFPHARFIEVSRDPCATASSLLDVPFWDGWRGPPTWRRGALPADLDALWQEEGQSFVALAALECVVFERAMQRCREAVPAAELHTVRYGHLCADPVGILRGVTDFCGLSWPGRFENAIGRVRLENNDAKWRSSLTEGQQLILLRTLKKAGYPDPGSGART